MRKAYSEKEKSEMRKALEEKLFLMRRVRFVIGICILFWGVLFLFFGISGFHPYLLFAAVFCEMFINQPYRFVVKRIKNLNWALLLHQIFDVVLITLCMHSLGGTDAYFMITVYALIIVFAGVIVTIRSSFLIAGLCSISYLILYNLEFFKIIPKSIIFNFDLKPPLNIIVLLFVCISLFLIAYISSFLAKIIIRKNEESKDALNKLKFAEDAMIQAEKLAVVGQFASGIIHEIKNPLGVILSGVEYLENEISDNPDLKFSLDKIKQGAINANEIIKDVLNFSRPSEQKLSTVDLNAIVNDNIRIVREVAAGPDIQIIKELAREPIIARLNPNQFEQVFFNIFMNACEAMPTGGKISIRTYRSEYQQKGSKTGFRDSPPFMFGEKIAVLEIQDEGVGISESNIVKVFDPFFTTKQNKENAGLGLVICRRIIDAHKGEMELKSVAGEGTIVIIRLPLFEEKKTRITSPLF
ncbi:MAG: ATP-binding protein [Candidatus Omnitrophica bacterium]|nr:ATP-binding protein [Candidatus Omnitrophota bacterium]